MSGDLTGLCLYMLNQIFNLARLLCYTNYTSNSSSSNLINTFDDLFRHTYIDRVRLKYHLFKILQVIIFCMILSGFLLFFCLFCSVSDGKSFFSVRKSISTSEWHAEHPFTGRNTQQMELKCHRFTK